MVGVDRFSGLIHFAEGPTTPIPPRPSGPEAFRILFVIWIPRPFELRFCSLIQRYTSTGILECVRTF